MRQIRLLLQSVSESSGTFYDPEDNTVMLHNIGFKYLVILHAVFV